MARRNHRKTTIIDPTGLVARHVATIKPKWD